MSLSDHVGRFLIRNDEMQGAAAQAILSMVVVHEAEKIHFPDAMEYVASSPMFRPKRPGETVPYYNIVYRDGLVEAREIDRDES